MVTTAGRKRFSRPAVLIITGLILAGLMVWLMGDRLAPYTWRKAPATILTSAIAEGNLQEETNPFHATVRFRYTFGGREYVSEYHDSFSEYREVQKLVDRYPAGVVVSCRVNPEFPQMTVLEPPAIGVAVLLLFPAALVAAGAARLFSLWFGKNRREAALEEIAGPARARRGLVPMLYLFFSLFALAGLTAFYSFLMEPLIRTIAASGWTKTPCMIIASRVRSSTKSHSEGRTFNVDILYSYAVKDRQYKSNRYDFSAPSNGFLDQKHAAVGRYPPGSTAVCYVNPSDPTDSVLVRRFDYGIDDVIQTSIFVLLGLAGLFFLIPLVKRRGPYLP